MSENMNWREDVVPEIKWSLIVYRERWKLDSLEDGEIIPYGYGLAYFDWLRGKAVLMPVPINVIVGALHRLKLWTRLAFLDDKLSEAYRLGVYDGRLIERKVGEGRRDLTRSVARPYA